MLPRFEVFRFSRSNCFWLGEVRLVVAAFLPRLVRFFLDALLFDMAKMVLANGRHNQVTQTQDKR